MTAIAAAIAAIALVGAIALACSGARLVWYNIIPTTAPEQATASYPPYISVPGSIKDISFIAENRRVANLLYQNRFTIDTNNNFGKVILINI